MTELDTLRSAFPEQSGPSPETVVTARNRLSADLSGTPASPRSNRLDIALTAGVAAVAITALAVPLVLTDPQPPAGDSAGIAAPEPLTAKQVLLAAAARQEQEPATGRFFRISAVSVWGYPQIVIGSGPSAYRLEQRRIAETWTSSGREPTWQGTRSLGARPATAADREKWRKAGSPTSWNLGPSDTVAGEDVIVTTGPDEGKLEKSTGFENRYFILGDRDGVTAEQIRGLPTDPAALGRHLLDLKPPPGEMDAEDDQFLFSVCSDLVSTVPAPPRVRAAAMRLMADLPGVRSKDGVKDALGRIGTAITMFDKRGNGSETRRFVIDPKTGKVLSAKYVGKVDGKTAKAGEGLILFSGWTNDTPRIPPATIR